MNRIERPRRRRVGLEHLDEMAGRERLCDERAWKFCNTEPPRGCIHRERKAVDDKTSTHGEFHRASARTERPAPAWRERREEDALMPAKVAWGKGCSMVAHIVAAGKAPQFALP